MRMRMKIYDLSDFLLLHGAFGWVSCDLLEIKVSGFSCVPAVLLSLIA